MIVQGAKIQADVLVTNNEGGPVTVTFLPTCTCLTVTPGAQSIPAGGRGSFSLRYDSIDDRGITIKGYLVTTDIAGAAPLHYLLRGTVREERGAPAAGGTWTRQERRPGRGRRGGRAAFRHLLLHAGLPKLRRVPLGGDPPPGEDARPEDRPPET